MTDAERIAAGLTKRSLRALPLIGEDWTDEAWSSATLPNPNDVYSLWWGRDGKHRLVEIRLKDGTGIIGRPAQWQWRTTPLGLEIRRILTELIASGEEG